MVTLAQTKRATRDREIVRALRHARGAVAAAARELGIQRSWLHVIIRRDSKLQRALNEIRNGDNTHERKR